MYFDNCKTTEELLHEYRRLALQWHPDRGGDLRTMQDINSEYADACVRLVKQDAYDRQAKAHAEGRKSAADYHDMGAVGEALRRMILAALDLSPDLVVELCGLWVWVSGDTKPYRIELKEAGFKYSGDKQAWYYAGVPSFNRQRRTLDEIRNMHGSTRFTRQAPRDEEARYEPAGALHA